MVLVLASPSQLAAAAESCVGAQSTVNGHLGNDGIGLAGAATSKCRTCIGIRGLRAQDVVGASTDMADVESGEGEPAHGYRRIPNLRSQGA